MSAATAYPINAEHIVGPVQDPIEGSWTVVATRECSNMLETWFEHLCVRGSGRSLHVGICKPEPLQDFSPEDWEDDFDRTDEESILPAYLEGKAIYGDQNGYIVGSFLVLPSKDEVPILDLQPSAIEKAVQDAGWERPSIDLVNAVIAFAARPKDNPKTTLPDVLIHAYLHTSYRYGPELTEELRIGERSAVAAQLLTQHGVRSAAFITGWNPKGRPVSDEINERLQTALCQDIDSLGQVAIPGSGVGADASWPAEESVLALGCTLEQAVHLGHHYRQNAIVWLGADAVPKLVLLQ